VKNRQQQGNHGCTALMLKADWSAGTSKWIKMDQGGRRGSKLYPEQSGAFGKSGNFVPEGVPTLKTSFGVKHRPSGPRIMGVCRNPMKS